jgi:hypothetical protein
MSGPLLEGSRFLTEMAQAQKWGHPIKWGNLLENSPNLSDRALEELGGIEGAMAEARRISEKFPNPRNVKGMTRKQRQEYYREIAIFEAGKEAERRAVWERRHPGASESNWLRREAKRKTRKQRERNINKALNERKSSSSKSHRRSTSKRS